MRVDKLNDEAFFNAMNEYVDLRTGWGESEEMKKELEEGTFFEIMKGFECIVYADGHISAPDGNTFRQIADGMEFQCDGAYMNALKNVVEYFQGVDTMPECETELEWMLWADGVVFDDDGNLGWIDLEVR